MNIYKISALLIVGALVSYALFLYFGADSSLTKTESRAVSTPLPSDVAQTRLFFSPSYRKIPGNTLTEIPLLVQTGGNSISTIQLELKYNPAVLRIVDVRTADFFTQPTIIINENDVTNGLINFVLDNNEKAINGSGIVAYLTLSPITTSSSSGTTDVTFLQKTAVRGSVRNESLLQSTESIHLDIAHITASSTPLL